nr:serine/arginine repetitive matrix protein 1-like [Aegilops tauschii subsp. strangulata]
MWLSRLDLQEVALRGLLGRMHLLKLLELVELQPERQLKLRLQIGSGLTPGPSPGAASPAPASSLRPVAGRRRPSPPAPPRLLPTPDRLDLLPDGLTKPRCAPSPLAVYGATSPAPPPRRTASSSPPSRRTTPSPPLLRRSSPCLTALFSSTGVSSPSGPIRLPPPKAAPQAVPSPRRRGPLAVNGYAQPCLHARPGCPVRALATCLARLCSGHCRRRRAMRRPPSPAGRSALSCGPAPVARFRSAPENRHPRNVKAPG